MPYPIRVENKIEHGLPELKFSYNQALDIADEVKDYLRENKAILVVGPEELSRYVLSYLF